MPKKKSETSVRVGYISDVSGEVNIAGGDIYKGYTSEQVSVLLTQITSTLQPKKFDGRCPYKGLDVFEEEDAELFFGRERLVDDLVSRVKESRTIFITGPSGSGKSSLVRAGLIHSLKQGAINALHSERWLYETIKPGREPIKDLALAFSRLKSPELSNYLLAHKNDINILNECAESVLSGRKDQRFLLFIDQFEEVFTQVNQEEERLAFLNMLAHAATVENGRVIVLFAMRSDFVSNCATYPAVNELLSQEFRQIGAMQPEELVSAIALPAKQVGLPIEDELIARIINDMKGEPGALPLMQFALKDLFDSQQEKGGVIALTLEDYLRHGGIHKSLERHADNSFAKLSENEQELAHSIFGGLIEIGRGTPDTRRTALFDELIPANTKVEDVQAIVQKLADERLITTDEQAGKDTVTISHEKLIDAWPWLKKLVNENRDAIALQNEIVSDAKEWEDHKRDPSYLYTGARLANAREQLEAKKLILSDMPYEFVQASINALDDEIAAINREEMRKKRLQKRIIVGLISFAAAILVLLIFALIQLNASRALQLGAQAQVAFAEQNYNAAALYAYQSNQIHTNDAANRVLNNLSYTNFELSTGLLGHTREVKSVAWSADGRLASGSEDNTIIIWDLSTGQPAQTLKGHTSFVFSVAWSADGRLASGSWDNTVIIWDLVTGQPAQILRGHTNFVNSVAWSADGRLASASEDNSVIIWDLVTGQPAQILRGHTNFVISVAWSADGHLASGSVDNSVIVWDLPTGQPVQTLRGHTDSVTNVAWSADGRLASGSWDNTVIIWDLATGQPAQILKGHTHTVTSVAWSPDGRLASGSYDNSVIIWDLAIGQPAQILRGHTDTVTSVAWSADGHLASGSWDNTVIISNTSAGQPAHILKGHTHHVLSVAWSADGRLASGSYDNTVIIWDLSTGQPAQTLKGHTMFVSSVAWSADGRLASGAANYIIIIWDLATGQPAQILDGEPLQLSSVAWSPDGRLASGSYDNSVIIWDLAIGQPAQTLKGHTGQVSSVAWSADGRLASGSGDGTVIIWDLATGQPTQILKGHTDQVSSVAWSADGRLASGSYDNTVIIWDLSTGQPAQILKGHTDFVFSVAWSADDRLASGSYDNTVIIWDLSTGQPAQTLKGHTDVVTSVAWSADGRLASGSRDHTVKIPRVDIMRSKPCNWIYRNMTVDEWLAYQGSLYIYRPACSNLPIFNPANVSREYPVDVRYALITAKGRIIIVGIGIILFSILAGILWGLYKLISWSWQKIYRRSRKEPSIV